MDQDETTSGAEVDETHAVDTEAPFEEPTASEVAAEELEGKRGPIVATLQVRVTIRDDVGGSGEGYYVPTNPEIEELVEAAFAAGGHPNVNATAEKV